MPSPLRRPDRWYGAYVFDLDGTIYLGKALLPGAADVVGRVRERGLPVRFLSNNPTRDRDEYAAMLTAMGLRVVAGEVVNTIVTTVDWLRAHHPSAVLFPIAEEPLCRALREAGFRLSEDPAEIDIVIASYDRGFDYRKLQIAFDAIWFHRRAFLIQTNPDRFCPFPGGRGEPDCAAVTAAIEACTGTRCRHSLGKPEPVMLETVLSGLGVPAGDVLMVGDRLQTDIAMAVRAGLDSALVLTGEATEADADALPAGERPTWVLRGVDEVVPEA